MVSSHTSPGVVYSTTPNDGGANVTVIHPPISSDQLDECKVFGKHVRLTYRLFSKPRGRRLPLSRGFWCTIVIWAITLAFATFSTVIFGIGSTTLDTKNSTASENMTSTAATVTTTTTIMTTAASPSDQDQQDEDENTLAKWINKDPILAGIIPCLVITVLAQICGFIGIYTLRISLSLICCLTILVAPAVGGLFFGLDGRVFLYNFMAVLLGGIGFIYYLKSICQVFRNGPPPPFQIGSVVSP